ncbi:unnamed protein product, partial [Ectocarpus sp. 4 AP-2014]
MPRSGKQQMRENTARRRALIPAQTSTAQHTDRLNKILLLLSLQFMLL